MMSFTVQPFDKEIFVTSDRRPLRSKYNSYVTASDDWMSAEEARDCLGMSCHLFHPDRDPKALFLIYIPPDSGDNIVYHECLHMVHHLFDYHGWPISHDATEAQTYMLEYLVREVQELLTA